MRRKCFFTSESVGKGHPDKICDQISDAVLDCVVSQDPCSRVACEVMITDGYVVVAGEIKTSAKFCLKDIVDSVLKDIGYADNQCGFDIDQYKLIDLMVGQSADISQGVDRGGAGDQGIMFGYACDESPELMPAAILYSHKIVRRIEDVRKSGILPYLRPDCKSQITFWYDAKGDPVQVSSVVLACQHTEAILNPTGECITEEYRKQIVDVIIRPILGQYIASDTKFYVNSTGRFVSGGPACDAGLTGRKVVVDTYGGYVPHGGGAFSGKDATKVDRSAAYFARYLAKNIVHSGSAQRCLIQLSYAIGRDRPLSVFVDTDRTGDDVVLTRIIEKEFDLSPSGIFNHLKLWQPIFQNTSVYGHFGRDEFLWEKKDCMDKFK